MKRLHHWTFSWRVNWQDVWVGVYWKRYCNATDFFVCLLPCLPLNVYVQWHHCLSHRDNVLTLLAYRPMTGLDLLGALNADRRHWWQRVTMSQFTRLMFSLEREGLAVWNRRGFYERAVTLPQ